MKIAVEGKAVMSNLVMGSVISFEMGGTGVLARRRSGER
jgi:hypothetical protein